MDTYEITGVRADSPKQERWNNYMKEAEQCLHLVPTSKDNAHTMLSAAQLWLQMAQEVRAKEIDSKVQYGR